MGAQTFATGEPKPKLNNELPKDAKWYYMEALIISEE